MQGLGFCGSALEGEKGREVQGLESGVYGLEYAWRAREPEWGISSGGEGEERSGVEERALKRKKEKEREREQDRERGKVLRRKFCRKGLHEGEAWSLAETLCSPSKSTTIDTDSSS